MSREARWSLSSGRIVMEEATVDDVRGPSLADPRGLGGRELYVGEVGGITGD